MAASSSVMALSVVAILLGVAALAVNFAIPGPQGPAGATGAQGAPGPAGTGLVPKTQQLRIELGEGEIIQEAMVNEATGETKLLSEEKGGEEALTGEFHRWEPNTLVVRKGDTVELTVVNPRKHAHSFALSAYNVDTGRIPGRDEQPDVAKRTVTVKFVADKPGVYKFECATPFDHAKKDCDADHTRMVGHLIVLDV